MYIYHYIRKNTFIALGTSEVKRLQKLIWQNLKKVFHLLHLQFVSHPYSQLVLNSEIYRDVPFLEKSSWKQFILILLAFVWYPLFFMVWLVLDTFFPKHEVSRMFHSPCVKFLVHCGSYQTFLFMLFLSSFKFQSDFLQYAIAGKWRQRRNSSFCKLTSRTS